MPRLCDRREDIRSSPTTCLRELRAKLRIPAGELTDEAVAMLGRYAFPGNVRELVNELEGAVIRADPTCRSPKTSFPRHLREPVIAAMPATGLEHDRMNFEREHIRAALERCDGVKKRAAPELRE